VTVDWLAPSKMAQYMVEAVLAVGVIVVGKLWMKWMTKSEKASRQACEAQLPPDPEPEKSE
jgi:hypothetical protein